MLKKDIQVVNILLVMEVVIQVDVEAPTKEEAINSHVQVTITENINKNYNIV